MMTTVTPLLAGFIVILFTFGGALVGRWLRSRLPRQHLTSEARDTIKLGIGLIATMSALVLGLVTASAKSSFDSMDLAIKQAATDTLTLDRLLARYGPETLEIRTGLKHAIAHRSEMMWPASESRHAELDPSGQLESGEELVNRIADLKPRNNLQKSLQTRSRDLAEQLLKARWLQATILGSSVPALFLTVLLGWMTVTFTYFGMLAPRNLTVMTALLLCSVSVGSAVFLILEMDGPFDGILRIDSSHFRYALENLGK